MKNDPQKKVSLPSVLIIVSIILLTVFYYGTGKHKTKKEVKIQTMEESYPLPKNEVENIFKKTEKKDEFEKSFSLFVGQTHTINEIDITLNKINKDNRCPSDVQCIISGTVETNITLEKGEDKINIDYSWDREPIEFYNTVIDITDVKPESISTQSISEETYKVTFEIKEKYEEVSEIKNLN